MNIDKVLIRSSLLVIFPLIFIATGLCQQQSQPEKKKPASSEDDVVRLSTTLVQIDAVVTDKKGRHISNLKVEDFEILEDGRPQKITHFNYVTDKPDSAKPAASENRSGTTPSPANAGQVSQSARMIALVVDDIGLTFENLAYVRSSLTKFVDSTMQPGDSIAIIRTSSGMGALQQFTSDKRLLHLAIDRIQWKGFSHAYGLFAPAAVDPRAPNMGGDLKNSDPDKFRENLFAVGTLGALNFVVRGLREFPGRKSVLLFSQNLPIFNGSNDKIDRIADALERLIDLANRASVVIYTMDVRGLSSRTLTASESIQSGKETETGNLLADKQRDYIRSQGGLSYLAQQTGGIFIHDTNDLRAGMERVIEEQNGFYLLGYQPEDGTFQPSDDAAGKPKKPLPYHKLTVRLKQSDLVVRSRSGFFALTNDQARASRESAEEQIRAALFSPFVAKDVHLRLTSLFATNPRTGPIVRSLVLIDARDLSFKKEPDALDGSLSAEISVVTITYDENGNVIDQVPRNDKLSVKPEFMEKAQANGIIYTFDVPIKKPGAYQSRLIVRDNLSGRIGSASQFIEVPDLKKNWLALSGIAITGSDRVPAEKEPTGQSASGQRQPMEDSDSNASPAVRQFRPSMNLNYIFEIYNAQLDKATKQPKLVMQSRLFRDGKEVYASAAVPVNVKSDADFRNIVTGMTMQLARDQQPGQYALEMTVTDMVAGPKHGTATQWIDFEVIRR